MREISLPFVIIDNVEYMMKSSDTLHYKFPACLSHNKENQLNVEHDEVKGFEPFVRFKFVVHRKAGTIYTS
jgi:hypothetical protein